jgi:hypothetical protein
MTRSDVLNGGCQTSENRLCYINAVLNKKNFLELVKYYVTGSKKLQGQFVGHFGKTASSLLAILAKLPVLCWLFWQNCRFFVGYFGKTVGSLSLLKKKLEREGSSISEKN